MIENNLLHFENDSTFQTEKTNIKEDSITFVKDSKKVYTHNKEYNMVNWGVLKKPEYKAGDICLVNNNTLEKLIIPANDYTLESYPADSYTPIGVVVVPNTHTDDGTARIISLAVMDRNNPDNGNTNVQVSMVWGGYGSDISTLDNKTAIPYITNTNYAGLGSTQQLVGWHNGSGSVPEMPSDYYDNSYPNPFDEGTCMGKDNGVLAPSPYLTGGGKNEIYHSTANPNSMCADMDGKSNTEKILAIDNGVSTDWQTAATITNADRTETIHPAAQCCWRYHTVGTQQGDWYLPSAGELGYLVSRWKAINASISKVRSEGFRALVLKLTTSWHSSTEFSSDKAVSLGFVSNYAFLNHILDKYDNYYVRAFLAV